MGRSGNKRFIMKKLFLSLSVMIALLFSSCGGSLESKKQQLEELENEASELSLKALNGEKVDEKKLIELSEKIEKLKEEINNMEEEEDYDDDDDD